MIANVSASDVSGDLVVISDTEDVEEPDIPDLYFGDDNNITSENIGRFFPGGSLDSNYSNSVLNFKGEFRDLGVLELSQSNVTVIGEGCVFYNTVFNIIGNDVYLSNLTFLLNESFYDSEGSAIFIQGDNVTINNIYINYTASYDAEAYGIYSYGTSRNPNDGLTIINSTINFVGQDFGEDVYTYAIRLDYSPNALIANNAINSKLILKPVNFQGGRSASDSDYSLTISASYCDNLIFIGNNVTSDAIGRSLGYPTLDCFFMWGCDDSYILNNSFLLTDFYTYYGVDNYLYCLDIYSIPGFPSNITLSSNLFS